MQTDVSAMSIFKIDILLLKPVLLHFGENKKHYGSMRHESLLTITARQQTTDNRQQSCVAVDVPVFCHFSVVILLV
jgi:hypothetical protein